MAAVYPMYEVARHDDLAALREFVTDDVYAFDAGARFTAEALIDAIRDLHAKGVSFEWNPGPADVHVTCELAWLSYVNDGVIADASDSHPAQWPESAVLVYGHERWRIRCCHSSKVPSKG